MSNSLSETEPGYAAPVVVPPRRPIPAPALADPLFDKFWSIYPRRVGKKLARRKWQLVTSRHNSRIIIVAAERFAAECSERGTPVKFIPHPSSWLSDERWADEPEENTAPASFVPPPPRRVGMNDEQLVATVLRLIDPERPITTVQAMIETIRRNSPLSVEDAFPVVTAERAAELARMPYPEYLLTPEWRARRVPMLEQAGHRCMVCCSPERLHVHHRTYARRGNELPSDLLVLCKSCHDLFTENGKLVKEPAA